MAVTDLTTKSKFFNLEKSVAGACVAFMCFLSTSVRAAEFDVGISAGASHTDNVFLAVAPNEIDDLVWRVSPFFNLTHTSPGLDAALNYRADWFRYSDLKRTSNFHTIDASLTGKYWQDSLNIEVGARRSQVLSDPDDVIPSGRLQLGTSLTDFDELYFNPRLVRDLGKTVTLQADYRYGRSSYSDSLIQEDTNHSGNFSLDNYRSGEGITWALRYNWKRSEYEISAPWENQRVGAELGFWMNAKTRIFGSGGKESDVSAPFDPALEDSFWEAGFSHAAGENLNLEFAAGERTFGSSWRGNAEYTFRRGSTSLSYVESPTTVGISQSGRRSVFDDDGFADFLNRPGSAEQYVSSTLQWNLTLNFRRTGFALSVFDEDRSDRVSATGLMLADQSQRGANVSFSWRAGTRTTFAANGSVVNREATSGNESRLVAAGLNVDYRLGSRTSVSLGYSYNEAEPRTSNFASQNYVANIVSLLFTITN